MERANLINKVIDIVVASLGVILSNTGIVPNKLVICFYSSEYSSI